MHNQEQKNPFFPPACWLDFFLISLFWVLAILLVNPFGDFPINDDWSYGIAVKRLLDSGTYLPTGWTSMALISQVLWGGLFSLIFGYSFEVLRLSTLVLSLFALLSVYLMVRQLGQGRWMALFIALIIAFNPVYFSLSNTFMTDVPFTAFSAMALLFFTRDIKKASKIDFLLGTVFSIIAVLCRQTALFIPLAFGLAMVYQNGFKRPALIRAILPLVVGLSALKGFQFWLDINERTPELYGLQIKKLIDIVQHPTQWPIPMGKNTYVALMYLGLFLVPLLALLVLGKTTDTKALLLRSWLKKLIIPFGIIMLVIVFLTDKLMPLGGNILTSKGIGPFSLYDTYTLKLSNVQDLPLGLSWAITIISILGSAAVVLYLSFLLLDLFAGIQHQQKSSNQVLVLFYLSGAIIYFMPILFLGFYDRYLLMMMILFSLAFLSYSHKIQLPGPAPSVVSGSLLALMTLFSLVTTHDYFSWNRARWEALQSIYEKEGTPGSQVNGGFEFNGWYLHSENSWKGDKSAEWWSDEDDIYVLTFGDVAGYTKLRSFEYNLWMPPKKGTINILKKAILHADVQEE